MSHDHRPSVPLFAAGAAACAVLLSAVGVLCTRHRARGELSEAYAEVDYQAVHADMAERRAEVAEQASEIKRAYYLEREVLPPQELELVRLQDLFQAERERVEPIVAAARKQADRLQRKIDDHLRRAKRLAKARRNLAGIKEVNDALALRPRQAEALYLRAVLRLRERDPDGAIADCDAALELAPDLVDALVTRGSAKRSQGDVEGAIADYGLAIKLDPTDVEALNNRGFVFAKAGRDAEAIRDYTRALRRDPTSVETYVNRAGARSRLGDTQGAAADYEHALRLLDDSGRGGTSLARTIARRRQTLLAKR